MPETLRTHQLSPAIIDLIESTKQHCYLVTPYFKPWPLLDRALETARKRQIKMTFLVRSNADNFREMARRVEKYEAELLALDRLHTKLYLNENVAITSSMNLYDSSNENNFELGILWKEKHFIRKLKETILDQELLLIEPRQHIKGWFAHEVEKLTAEVAAFREALKAKGFCVTCGEKIDFDGSPSLLAGTIVRCRPCWHVDPTPAERYRFEISFCHYCGDRFKSVLTEPFHSRCWSVVSR